MNRVFIKYYRSFISHNKKTLGDDDWAVFETMLKYCLQKLSVEFNQNIIPLSEELKPDAIISAHHSKNTDADSDIFYKQMHLSYLFTIDTDGWGPQHSMMQSIPSFETVDTQKAITFCKHLSSDFLTKGYSKQKQPPINSLHDTPEHFIFAPIQRPTDVMIKNNSPIGVADFITLLSNWAEKSQQHIVFKLHPGNFLDPDIVAHTQNSCKDRTYVHVVDGNIHELIQKSKGVMCINSGTGFESLIHGKPVVTFGRCDYKWVTFNANEKLLDQANEYIDAYTKNDGIRGYQLVYYYYHEHSYSIKEGERSQSTERLLSYLRKTFEVILSNKDQFNMVKETNTN
ncbi:capsular polysaccharide export protein, LipB/KpsS family [Aquimarina sp. 2201CG14-23]|uniref:capsular polysaccharide export protein, LipB/KpsS family n=1 Tax=Aquimarina mycalae TaxID=3040073 RepID=UPI00247821F4|nr:hypothetical protein [Aquimarina sp. 2201CG14-23]MDH7448105.1 hypothetical protein [Aquimarina sp. 2201CG14-23]